MMLSDDLPIFLEKIFKEKKLIYGVLSHPKNKLSEVQKTIIRPIEIKGKKHYQISEQKEQKIFHHNVLPEECEKIVLEYILYKYKQALFFTNEADYHILLSKKGKISIFRKAPTKAGASLAHNRKKLYILPEGTPVPFLVELGVMTSQGDIVAKKSDKFKQINRFLELVADVAIHLDKAKVLNIIDFGCGKAYLTFALYHYLNHVLGITVKITGLDLKADVVQNCQNLSKKLGYDDLNFIQGDINQHECTNKVDMVVSLHACDTATDAAIEKAIRWGAEIILAVPCCQHELYSQVKNESLNPLLRHGILKERFAALATDAARVQILEILGYQTQILEFIDLEHTPKNLLIRAVKKESQKEHKQVIKNYAEFKKALNIHPSLEARFSKELGMYSAGRLQGH